MFKTTMMSCSHAEDSIECGVVTYSYHFCPSCNIYCYASLCRLELLYDLM
jgi:hypothetical protein